MSERSTAIARIPSAGYEVESEIGRGGTAIVYLARDRRHDRQVAIKMLLPELASAVNHERFLHEIRLTARLQHPHILPLYDSGVVDDVPFYVMPFVDGGSLRGRLEREPRLPVHAALQLAAQVSRALACAHAHHIVHRDVKPENILLGTDHAYVADFGIARAVGQAGHSRITGAGIVVGTPGYMSPEQAAGGRQIDERADIYSLACVLYEMLTGHLPADPLVAVRQLRPEVSDHVSRALARALSVEPNDRFATMREFGNALDGGTPRGWSWRGLPPARWAIAGAVTIAVAGVAAVSAPGLFRSAPPRAPDPRRIAVLYFDDHSERHNLGYLANGLTESLIHELSGIDAIHVISRNGVKPFRDHETSLDSLVARLHVGSVVEGSVQRSNGTVRVTVQLVDAESGTQLASSTLERPMGELFELEDDLTHEVAAALRRRLGAEIRLRETVVATTSPKARELVLMADKAREDAEAVARNPDTLDTPAALALLARADSLFMAAEGADPTWNRPLITRGWIANDVALLTTGERSIAVVRRGLGLAERALRQDPNDASAAELRGTLEWRLALRTPHDADNADHLSSAENDLRRAVALDPTLASAWSTLSQLLQIRGAFAESDVDARRALAQDAYLADAPTILDQLYTSALKLRDYRSAAKWCERGRRDYPDLAMFVQCELTLLREDISARADPTLAWTLVRTLDSLDPPAKAQAAGHAYDPIFRLMVAAAISARAGDVDSARAVAARARRLVAGQPELATDLDYDEAYLRLVLGERDAAVRLLQAYVDANPSFRPFIARDPLIGDLESSLRP